MRQVLVLNPGFQAIEVIQWKRAITLWWEKKVEIVESSDKTIRSINFEMKMPSIIRFLKADGSKRRAVRFSRENVLSRDGYRCQYCGNKVSRDLLTYDHVLPRNQGGQTTWENIVTSCVDCNQRKGGRTPEQANMRILSVPIKPKKLSQTVKFCLTWNESYPDSWKNWLTDVNYWHGVAL